MKTKILILIIGLLILSATSAFSAEFLTKSDSGTWYYALGREGSTAQGTVYQEVYVTLVMEKPDHKGGVVEKMLYLVDCFDNRITIAVAGSYDGKGNLIGELLTVDKVRWKEIQPGSVGSILKRKICGSPI